MSTYVKKTLKKLMYAFSLFSKVAVVKKILDNIFEELKTQEILEFHTRFVSPHHKKQKSTIFLTNF